jgi:hypothetical protein
MIICDFFTPHGQFAADQLGIPCMIHTQLPFKFLCIMMGKNLPSKDVTCACMGMFCTWQHYIHNAMELYLNLAASKHTYRRMWCGMW